MDELWKGAKVVDALLSADAPGIPHLGILGLLMAHWELPFTVGFQRAMTG